MKLGHRFQLGCSLVAFALLPSLAWAGQIVKKDGSIIYGQIVEETEKEVVIATSRKGMSLKMAIYRTEIKSIDKDAVEPAPAATTAQQAPAISRGASPVYYPIPLLGEVGKEITAASLKVGLGEARAGKAQYAVLVIDTPGGSIEEMSKILDVLAENRDVTVVAYVRRALSAGAVIALSCPKIVMAPSATLGAAVPWHMSKAGTPANVTAKFEAAFRAQCRSTAERAGHSPLIADGMIDADLILSLITEQGKPKVVEGASIDGKPFKPAGQILCMTASEALAAGVSVGTSETLADARESLGIEPWHQADGRAWGAVAQKVNDDQKEQHYRDVKAEKAAKRDEIRRKLVPVLSAMNDQLLAIQADGKAAEDTMADIRGQYRSDVAAVEHDYKNDFLNSKADPNRIALAQRIHDDKIAALNAQYQPQMTVVQDRINILNRRQQALKAKMEPLVLELKKADQL